MLFQGTVSRHHFDTLEGFTVGDVFIRGDGAYAGSEYRIWFKNEHMAAWRDGRVDASVPDLITVFNEDTVEPNLNPYFNEGMKVSVVGLPAPAEWRTPAGVEAFGPRHFGLDFDYTPIEIIHA